MHRCLLRLRIKIEAEPSDEANSPTSPTNRYHDTTGTGQPAGPFRSGVRVVASVEAVGIEHAVELPIHGALCVSAGEVIRTRQSGDRADSFGLHMIAVQARIRTASDGSSPVSRDTRTKLIGLSLKVSVYRYDGDGWSTICGRSTILWWRR